MSDEGTETFQVSGEEAPPQRRQGAPVKKFLHVTIVDHNPIIDGTDEASFIDVRIPLGMVEAGLSMVPEGKLGNLDPQMIVQMVNMGAEGELIRTQEEKKSVHVRVE
jgi:hypothetical protein